MFPQNIPFCFPTFKKNQPNSLLIFNIYSLNIILTDYLACFSLCNQKRHSFIFLKSEDNSNPFRIWTWPKVVLTLKCPSKYNLDAEANSSLHFMQQNLQDPVIMASYTDSMYDFKRNYISFKNMLDFSRIVPAQRGLGIKYSFLR